MRRFLFLLLYLNIYTAIIFWARGQELTLEISSEILITKSLNDSIKTQTRHLDYRSLEKEAYRIESYLRKTGYIENELLGIEKKNDSLFRATYLIGHKYKFLKILFDPENFSKKQIRNFSKNITGDSFVIPISNTEATLSKLNESQVTNGNAFAKLNIENFRRENDTLIATLNLNYGRSRKIDSITIKGYSKFPRSFIKHYAGIKKGQIFNKEELVKKNKILNNLGFTNSSKSPEALFGKEKTTVFLYLEKQNNNNFDGILGFASKEDGSGLELNGYINLALNNNLNFGEQLLINYKADGEEQRNFNVKALLPYILKSPIGISLELKLFRRDSTFSTNEQKGRILYQAKPSSSFFIGYKSNNSSNLQQDDNISDIEDYEAQFATGGFEYRNYQNNELFPLKSNIEFEIEIGSRKTTVFSNQQTRLQNSLFYIVNLNNKNSIFLKNSTSILFSDQYLTNELFRFGGITNIRGFSENSIDASLFSVLNTEYRYILSSKTYIHSIIDLGYFENEVIDQKEKLYSFGIGLGLQTKAGIFNFNFANGNIENQDFKFSNSKIHFSLTTNF